MTPEETYKELDRIVKSGEWDDFGPGSFIRVFANHIATGETPARSLTLAKNKYRKKLAVIKDE